MTDLSTVQTAADRKTVCDDAIAAQAEQDFIDAEEAARQQTYVTHFSRVISNWCNETDTESPSATEGTLSLPINEMITGNVLDDWETDLTDQGYTVVRGNASFTITLPA